MNVESNKFYILTLYQWSYISLELCYEKNTKIKKDIVKINLIHLNLHILSLFPLCLNFVCKDMNMWIYFRHRIMVEFAKC